MKPGVLLIGGGGHCRSCIEVIESSGQYDIQGIVGLPNEIGQSVLGYRVLGSDEHLPDLIRNCPTAMISIGQIQSAQLRVKIYNQLLSLGAQLPVIVASSAIVSPHATIGQGTIVMHGAIVNAGAVIGNNGIINSRALVEHDVQIDSHCHVSTAAVLNGGVRLGQQSFVGSGAVVHQSVKIGGGSVIAAGSVVRRDVVENTVLRSSSADLRDTANA